MSAEIKIGDVFETKDDIFTCPKTGVYEIPFSSFIAKDGVLTKNEIQITYIGDKIAEGKKSNE